MLLNGTTAVGVISVETTHSAHYTADTFRVELALSAQPASQGAAWWSSLSSVSVDIAIGMMAADGAISWVRMVLGNADNIDVSLPSRTITISGRDLSATLLDSKTTEKFQNQTSSQIAATLAARHGLTTDIIATTTKAGTYYEIDHAQLSQEQSEWGLLAYLSEREGYDLWVSGNTLHFRPPPAPTASPYVLLWSDPGAGSIATANYQSLQMHRSLTLANDVVVQVKSWHQGQEKAFVSTFKVSPSSGKSKVPAQTYVIVRPNLTPDQALQLAKSKAEEITRHERKITAVLPGDTDLDARSPLKLTGTGTDWDQTYWPDVIERNLSFEGGFTMTVQAKNHSPQSQTVL